MGSFNGNDRVLNLGDKRMVAEYLKSSTKQTVDEDMRDSIAIASTSFPPVTMAYRGMFRNMFRVISFDSAIYAEVAGNKGATVQALSIVLLSAFAAGVPAYIAAGSEGIDRIVSQVYIALVGWVLWVSITYFVGTQIIRKQAPERDWKSMARALGFAQSVGILRIFGIIPGLGFALTLTVLVWMFVASVVAIRGAFGFESNWRAIGVVAISVVPFVPVMVFLSLLMVRS